MFWVQALVAVAIVCGTVIVAAGRGDGVTLPPRDAASEWADRDGQIGEQDLDSLQIGVAARGYRMEEVDAVLDRLGSEIGARDARIAQLEHVLEVTQQEPAPTPAGLPPSAWDPPRRPGAIEPAVEPPSSEVLEPSSSEVLETTPETPPVAPADADESGSADRA